VIEPTETALLVPVPEAESLVESHRVAHDPVAPLGVPAHITILYPFIPPDAIDDFVEGKVAEVLRGFAAFDFELRDVRTFDDGVLYLAPEPAEPFTALTSAFAVRWPEHPPYDGSFTDIVPHLTVAMAAGAPIARIADELRRGLPVRSRAETVWLMEGRKGGGGWKLRAAFPLTDGRT
jgi:2'-5' RNA ligase